MTRRGLILILILESLLIINIETIFANATEGSWIEKTSMPTPRSGLGVAVANEKIYALGGANQEGFLATNEEYNPTTNTWTTKKPMPTARSSYGIATYQNKIYCFGGYSEDFSTTEANEVYNPTTDTWKTLAPMPTPRLNIQANIVDQKIYIIGGDQPSKYYGSDKNEVYDPSKNTWETKTSIPIPVSTYASTVVENKIYIITSSLTQIYNVENDSWSFGTPPACPVLHASARTIIDELGYEKIYVFGVDDNLPDWHFGVGDNPPYFQKTNQDFITQCYYPETDQWILYDSIPSARFSTSVAVFDDSFFVIGGYVVDYPDEVFTLNPNILYSNMVNQYTPLESVTQTTLTDPSDTPTPESFPTSLVVASIAIIAIIGIVILVYFKKYRK